MWKESNLAKIQVIANKIGNKNISKPVTFGNLITNAQHNNYYGFIYSIKVANFIYVGKKTFQRQSIKSESADKLDGWKYYQSSSVNVKKLINRSDT